MIEFDTAIVTEVDYDSGEKIADSEHEVSRDECDVLTYCEVHHAEALLYYDDVLVGYVVAGGLSVVRA